MCNSTDKIPRETRAAAAAASKFQIYNFTPYIDNFLLSHAES